MLKCAVNRYCDTRGSSTRPDFTMYQPIAPCRPPSTNMPASFSASGRSMRLRHQNQSSGRRNTTPIMRPSSRWKYSHQKMPLNASRLIPWLTFRYSGVSLYLSKASSHWASFTGGRVPMIGCHSTIDSPEWVSRVTPPTTTMANTSAQQASSHAATWSRARAPGSPPASMGAASAGRVFIGLV